MYTKVEKTLVKKGESDGDTNILMMQCSAVQCSAVQWCTVHYIAVQCSAVENSTIQYSAIQGVVIKCSENNFRIGATLCTR